MVINEIKADAGAVKLVKWPASRKIGRLTVLN
jgi:hypothetical protein